MSLRRIALLGAIAALSLSVASCDELLPPPEPVIIVVTSAPTATEPTPRPSETPLPSETPAPSATPVPTATATPEPTPTETPAPSPTAEPTAPGAEATAEATAEPSATPPTPGGVLQLKAPRELRDLWQSWNGKYVLYAQTRTGIQQLRDLDGKTLFCGLIDLSFNATTADANALAEAGGVTVSVLMQSHIEYYCQQMVEKPDRLGFMPPQVAEACGCAQNPNLVRVEWVK